MRKQKLVQENDRSGFGETGSTYEIEGEEVEKQQNPSLPLHAVETEQKPSAQTDSSQSRFASKRVAENRQDFRERCRQFVLPFFFHQHPKIQSLGFTSAINGEGKSIFATVTADILSSEGGKPVLLVDCNWQHPCLHSYLSSASLPGLAEWLRQECSLADIRHQVNQNLSIIPAGNGQSEAVKLLQEMQVKGLAQLLGITNEILIVDLPSVITTPYGLLAATLVESLMLVVKAGVTSNTCIVEASMKLKNMPVYGVLLNQVESRIPRWIRSVL